MSTTSTRPRGRPRRSSYENRTTIFGIRLTPAERQKLQAQASMKNMSDSDWARKILLAHSEKRDDKKLLALLGVNEGTSFSPPSINHVEAPFIQFYQLCDSLAWTQIPKNNDQKLNAYNRHVSNLLSVYSNLAKFVRQLVYRKHNRFALEVLVNSCVESCNLLRDRSIRLVLAHHACRRLNFPVLMSPRSALNKELMPFLHKIKVGTNQQGLRQESKWKKDAFFDAALPIVEHVERLIIEEKLQSELGVSVGLSKRPEDYESCVKTLCQFAESMKDGMRAPKGVQDNAWKVVDRAVIGSRKDKAFEMYHQISMVRRWEDFFEDTKLQRAVSSTCSSGKRSPNPEIKKRIKNMFFNLFDRPPAY